MPEVVMHYQAKRDRNKLVYVYDSTDMMPVEGNETPTAYKTSAEFSIKKGDILERDLVDALGFMDTSLFREVPFTPNITIASLTGA